MLDEIREAKKTIEDQLKPFQKASVNYVLDQFLKFNRKKILIADEVGLGKTIIAKGVITNLLDKKVSAGENFHVVYICSNQVLARQNIDKLNPLKETPVSLSRLVYLAYKQEQSDSSLELSSLSPGTSFELTRSEGTKEERAIIAGLLAPFLDYCFNSLINPLKEFMKGRKQDLAQWDELVDHRIKERKILFKEGLDLDFKAQLESLKFNKKGFPWTSKFLNNKFYSSFYDAFKAVLKEIKSNDPDVSNIRYEIIRTLRLQLTKVCIKHLKADLFILDEFQRFKNLLDPFDISEAGELAKEILHREESNVLLLSATPFKPYTTQLEQLNGESHFEEFKKIVLFLGGKEGANLWKNFKKDQEAFYQILRHPTEVLEQPEQARLAKLNLENSFKKFLSRNERLSIATEYDNMTSLAEGSQISIIPEDIHNFIALDQLCEELKKDSPLSMRHFGSTIEFSKSSPYPLSFLHNYKLHNYILENNDEIKISRILNKFPNAWIDYSKVQNYNSVGFHKEKPAYPNGKFRALAEECFKRKAEFLLWVPSSRPFYKPFGVFKEAGDFSKILIFSNWAMVPRAISTLLSYEVERRTIGAEQLENLKEDSKRKYFTEDNKRRPRPLLLYKKNKEEDGSIPMSNFILVYPSLVGIEINSLLLSNQEIEYLNLKKAQKILIEEAFSKNKIKNKFVKNSKTDKAWYWLAMPLLDYLTHPQETKKHLQELSKALKGIEKENVLFLTKFLETIQDNNSLGDFPEDLFEVLAEVILASPANNTLFAFQNNFEEIKNGIELYNSSYLVADAFLSHFNKPESISAIRLASTKMDYWRQVLNYCASGNIGAMLTEYIYLLMDCEGKKDIASITQSLRDVLTISSSTNQVDLRRKSGKVKPYNMRTHFAVNYGNQKINSESGKNRMVNLRTVFNSPFRPFVLASTSVGQEGLDFHYYCHKIFHWNLPHNAIDLEQREGRINRYKGHVIRKKIAEVIPVNGEDNISTWKNLFNKTEKLDLNDKSGIKPFWYMDKGETKIQRFVPIHKLSKDNEKFDRLKSTLALYRLTFGQPRQEELIELIKSSGLDEKDIRQLRKDLLINLSPYNSTN